VPELERLMSLKKNLTYQPPNLWWLHPEGALQMVFLVKKKVFLSLANFMKKQGKPGIYRYDGHFYIGYRLPASATEPFKQVLIYVQ
jgi:hypothetical protein